MAKIRKIFKYKLDNITFMPQLLGSQLLNLKFVKLETACILCVNIYVYIYLLFHKLSEQAAHISYCD